ncbi:hypothetical protein [Robertkochia flava]|uniref:hypothetical protein n=1 Tax=Robertkochia flava TaxID=3447986 RepID=UPI001CCCA158|nr:hypothetical protein [Robertkochia marina]
MKPSYTPLFKNRYLSLMAMAFLVVSCGSFEAASYYGNDGIYSDDIVYYEEDRPQTRQSQNNQRPQDNTSDPDIMTNFENYFSNTSQTLDRMITQMDEQDVFTDIDGYSSVDSTDVTDSTQVNINYAMDYQMGNPGWGDNPQGMDVTIVNTGWGWGGWYDPFWGPGWGWNGWYGGWNGWYGGWYGPGWGWGWGWNSPYWGYAGFYGAGWYGGWYGPGWGWGYGWGYPYYGYNPYRRSPNYAYANTRRSTRYNDLRNYTDSVRRSTARNSQYSGRNRTAARSSQYSDRNRTTAATRSGYSNRQAETRRGYSNSAGVRVGSRGYSTGNRNSTLQRRYNQSSPYSRSDAYSRPSGRANSSGNYNRSNSSRRSPSARPSGSSGRSGSGYSRGGGGGSVRSSGGGSRGGGSRGGGSRGGGRGNN